MGKKTVLVITGTRAEYGLLRSTIKELHRSAKLDCKLLVTGAHTLASRGHTIDEIKKDGFPIGAVVPVEENDDMLSALTKEVAGIAEYLQSNRIDLVLVLGDRDEPFAAAIAAVHLGIPVAHIHGGDVSSGVVDDYLRHALTKLSHLHFVVSKNSFERVLRLAEDPSRVFLVGAPGLDAVNDVTLIERATLADKYGINVNKKWIILLQHPAPLDVIAPKEQLTPTIDALDQIDAEKIVIYPNTDSGSQNFLNTLSKLSRAKGYLTFKNLPRIEYLSFLNTADALVGNSSSGIIESGYFGIPVVNVGNRQKGRECGKNVLHVPYNSEKIESALRNAIGIVSTYRKSDVAIYGEGTAGKKIAAHIEEQIQRDDLFTKKFFS